MPEYIPHPAGYAEQLLRGAQVRRRRSLRRGTSQSLRRALFPETTAVCRILWTQ